MEPLTITINITEDEQGYYEMAIDSSREMRVDAVVDLLDMAADELEAWGEEEEKKPHLVRVK